MGVRAVVGGDVDGIVPATFAENLDRTRALSRSGLMVRYCFAGLGADDLPLVVVGVVGTVGAYDVPSACLLVWW